MVLIRFPSLDVERRALGFLARRFTFKSWDTGQTLVPEAALGALAAEGLTFTVEGRPAYEQRIPAIRNSASSAVQ